MEEEVVVGDLAALAETKFAIAVAGQAGLQKLLIAAGAQHELIKLAWMAGFSQGGVAALERFQEKAKEIL